MGRSTTLSILLLCLAVAAPLAGRRSTGDYLHPGALVLGTWAATLALFFLHVIPYADVSGSTMAVIAASVGLLVSITFASRRFFERSSAGTHPTLPGACVAAMAILGLLGTAWYVWDVTAVLGPDAFFVRPPPIRTALSEGRVPSHYLILQFLCVATPILAAALSLTGHRLRPSVWILVVLCTAGTWISTDRTQFFLVVLTTYFMWTLRRGRGLSAGGFVVSSAAMLGVLGTYFLAIGVWQGKTPEVLGLDVRAPGAHAPAGDVETAAAALPGPVPAAPVPAASLPAVAPPAAAPPAPAPVASVPPEPAEGPPATPPWLARNLQRVSTIYLYATGSYAALDVLLNDPPPRTHGAHVVYPIVRAIERVGLGGPTPPNIPPFVPLGLTSGRDVSFNSFTFLYYPLSDFGPAGALGYSALVGLLAAFVYGRYSQNRESTFWLLTMGHLSTALVLTVFVNKFNNTASWYIYLWSCAPFLLTWVLSLRGRPAASAAEFA